MHEYSPLSVLSLGKQITMNQSYYRSWPAYQKGRELARRIFEVSRKFPKYEMYSLTDQIGRSSRSICSNLAESFAKRRYPKHFISKITDAAGENYETQTWIEFADMFNYMDEQTAKELMSLSEEVGRLLS